LKDSYSNQASEINDKEISLKLSVKDIEEKIEKLKNGECPLCGSEINSVKMEEFEEKKRKLLFEVEREEKLLEKHKNMISGCDKERDNIKKEQSQLRKERKEVEKLNKEQSKLDRIKEKENLYELGKRNIDRYIRTAKKLSLLKEKFDKKYKSKNKKLSTLEEDIYELTRNLGKLEEVERKITELRSKVKEEKSNRDRFKKLIEDSQKAIEKQNKKYEELDNKINKFLSIMDYLDYIKAACKDENAKQYALTTIIPFLNKKTNHYLSEVGHNFYLVLDKWFDSQIKGPGISNCSYGSLSGGECKSVDLALQFALLDVARIQAGVFPDILITDELLDSSIDGTSIDKLFNIVRKKQEEDDLKIFIVSHRREIDELSADRKYLVTKEGGFSYIKLNS
jgi:DNA repair exonuclease SbcCD ATPase subunit